MFCRLDRELISSTLWIEKFVLGTQNCKDLKTFGSEEPPKSEYKNSGPEGVTPQGGIGALKGHFLGTETFFAEPLWSTQHLETWRNPNPSMGLRNRQ